MIYNFILFLLLVFGSAFALTGVLLLAEQIIDDIKEFFKIRKKEKQLENLKRENETLKKLVFEFEEIKKNGELFNGTHRTKSNRRNSGSDKI